MNKGNTYNLEKLQQKALEIMIVFDEFCRKHNLTYYMLGGTMLGAYRHKGIIPWDDDIDVGMPRKDYEKFVDLVNVTLTGKYFAKNPSNTKQCPFVFTRFEDVSTTYIEAARDKNNYVGGAYIEVFPLDGASTSRIKRQIQTLKIKYYKYLLAFKILDEKSKKRPWYKVMIIKYAKNKYSIEFLTEKLCKTISQFSYKNSEMACNHIGHWGIRECINKKDFEPPREYEFEGRYFYGPSNPSVYLTSLYGKNYMTPPSIEEREKGKHLPAYMNLELPYEKFREMKEKGDIVI